MGTFVIVLFCVIIKATICYFLGFLVLLLRVLFVIVTIIGTFVIVLLLCLSIFLYIHM